VKPAVARGGSFRAAAAGLTPLTVATLLTEQAGSSRRVRAPALHCNSHRDAAARGTKRSAYMKARARARGDLSDKDRPESSHSLSSSSGRARLDFEIIREDYQAENAKDSFKYPNRR